MLSMSNEKGSCSYDLPLLRWLLPLVSFRDRCAICCNSICCLPCSVRCVCTPAVTAVVHELSRRVPANAHFSQTCKTCSDTERTSTKTNAASPLAASCAATAHQQHQQQMQQQQHSTSRYHPSTSTTNSTSFSANGHQTQKHHQQHVSVAAEIATVTQQYCKQRRHHRQQHHDRPQHQH